MNPTRRFAGPRIDRRGLSAVVERRRGAVRVDVTDLRWNNFCGCTRRAHRGESSMSLRMRLSEVMEIRARAVAGDFSKNVRATFASMLERLQCKHRGAFAQGKSIAVRIEGTARCPRKRLQ